MSELFWRAMDEAGLSAVARARLRGDVGSALAATAQLERCDLMALGALADEIRRREVGDRVTVHARRPRESARSAATDLEKLRAFAIARITQEPGVTVTVDWSETGLELAQVALGFGANALTGAMQRKAGLPVIDGETQRVKGEGQVEVAELKRRELSAVLAAAGREVVFVEEPAPTAARSTVKKGAPHARLDP
jgi:2-iminoacetate synthase ThiH